MNCTADENEEIFCLSDQVSVYRNRPLTQHAHVFEGVFANDSEDIISCAVKFPREESQYERETTILNQLDPNDHVISLLQFGCHQDTVLYHRYVVFERCHDLNLYQLVTKREANLLYDVNWGFNICKQIIDGVTFIHEALIIHKDLKPSNVLITLDLERIKIGDFGSSQKVSSFSTAIYCTEIFGTTGYRPPESYGNSYVSQRSDTFSLGAIFYFLLSNGKSPFGQRDDTWDYNARYGITNMCDLRVPNRRTTKHLISSMLHTKRNRRPSIWEVFCHPCWSGDDIEFEHDYWIDECLEGPENSTRITENPERHVDADDFSEVLRSLQTKPKRTCEEKESCLVICNKQTSSLERFYPGRNTLKHLHKYNNEMRANLFSAVAVDSDIYVLNHNKSVYRLMSKRARPAWMRMEDMIMYHGQNPPAVALSSDIYVVGKSGIRLSNSVSRFQPSKNEWIKLTDKKLATANSAIVGSDNFIYSIGGAINLKQYVTNTVERLNVKNNSWDSVSSLLTARHQAAGVVLGGHIYVFGGKNHQNKQLNTAEQYNPENDQWTMIAPMTKPRWGSLFRCHVINGHIYIVGGDTDRYAGKTIEQYDRRSDKWITVDLNDPDIEIWSSATVLLESTPN